MTRIEEIEAREKAASSGLWSVSETTDDGFCIPGVAYLMGVNAEANATFIAHAREDIPYFLAQLREAREENKALKRRMGKAGWETALLLRRAEGKLEAVEKVAEKLPPLDWKPRDEWGDYTAYPCADGSLSGVDETNQGDVHCHGIVVGEQAVRRNLDRILHPQAAE